MQCVHAHKLGNQKCISLKLSSTYTHPIHTHFTFDGILNIADRSVCPGGEEGLTNV